MRCRVRSLYNVVNTSSGFARIIERDPPILSVSRVFCLRHVIGEIFLRKFVHLGTDFFSSIMFELRFTHRDYINLVEKSCQDSSSVMYVLCAGKSGKETL